MNTPGLSDGVAAGSHSAPAAGRLPHLGALRIAGPDAINFLQGQVSNDTRRLAAGEPLLAAYSSAQGRVIAVLNLLPHTSGVIALLPRDVLAVTAERLRKFVLRAKVKIEDVTDRLSIIGVLDPAGLSAAAQDVPDARGYLERDGVAIARVGPRTAGDGAVGSGAQQTTRFWIVRETSLPFEHADADIEAAWRLADIRAGLPAVYAANSEAFVAQMLNLDLIDGISFAKGCYTGQEIIARTQNLGRIKRRMFHLRLPPGPWSIGQPLRLTDGRSGRLTELAPIREGFEALAVLSLDAASGDTESPSGETISAEELPLPYRAT
jgi:tRNA-modifying protein YgfZ